MESNKKEEIKERKEKLPLNSKASCMHACIKYGIKNVWAQLHACMQNKRRDRATWKWCMHPYIIKRNKISRRKGKKYKKTASKCCNKPTNTSNTVVQVCNNWLDYTDGNRRDYMSPTLQSSSPSPEEKCFRRWVSSLSYGKFVHSTLWKLSFVLHTPPKQI